MPDVKISAGADPGTVVATDKVPLARSASTTAYAATMAELATYANGAYTPNYYTGSPSMDGTAAPGSLAFVARGDHVHPSDTSRAPLASPTFTGDPKAPTPTVGDNDTSIATTAFVTAAVAGATGGGPFAPLASPAFTGNPTAPTATAGDNDTSIATTAFVTAALTPYAPLASPAFTGTLTNLTGTARLGPGVSIGVGSATLVVDNSSGLAFSVMSSQNAAAAISAVVRNDRTDGTAIQFLFGAGGNVGNIRQNGTTTAYNTSSDHRLKDLHGLAETGAMIDAVPVHLAAFKAFPEREPYPMFVAHELAEACPWAVSGDKDAVRGDGEIEPQQVNHSGLVAVLWAEVRSLRQRVAELEASADL